MDLRTSGHLEEGRQAFRCDCKRATGLGARAPEELAALLVPRLSGGGCLARMADARQPEDKGGH